MTTGSFVFLTICLLATPVNAQSSSAPAENKFKAEEIDALVAPIALYPDSLLTQILMAATYPVEIVQANRWVKANPNLKGDALADELEKQTWDPSVKSLVNFPDVLTMLSEKLDWTVKLGDAFIEQQQDVMDAVQRLRAKAQAAGNLKTNEQQIVSFEQPETGSGATPATPATTTQIITIQPANPQVIYVPTYNPTIIYGAWPYPYYPPYYYYPPGYVVRPGIWFGAGFACGAAWGYAWGHCNWQRHSVNININQNININNRINRTRYQSEFNRTNFQGNRDAWRHDSFHRRGVAYRDAATNQQFGRLSSQQAVTARQEFRGREARGNPFGASAGQSPAAGINRSTPSNLQNRSNSNFGSQNRPGASNYPSRPNSGGANIYTDINRGTRATQTYSQRGGASRGTPPAGAAGSRGGGRGGR